MSERQCSVPGCERIHCAKDLCRMHYLREYQRRRAEDPEYAEHRRSLARARYRERRQEALEYARSYRENNRAEISERKRASWHRFAEAGREYNLKKKYGLTTSDYERMVDAQGGACALCEVVPEDRLVVDHCHQTGRVRALLCGRCNSGIGFLRDDPVLIELAVGYLSTFERLREQDGA